MNKMYLGGIILIVALMVGTYVVAGDSFSMGEDYINDLTMLGAFAVIAITVGVALKYVNQIKNDKATGELGEEEWDGIGEYKNPIPVGWGAMFIILLVWQLWYFFSGYATNTFSQIGQYNEEVNEYNGKFEAKWTNPDAQTLKDMGASIFNVQCAPCHGVDAEGIDGKAQDLTHRIAVSSIKDIIARGSDAIGPNPAGNWGYPMGMMPPMLVTGADADSVANFIAGGMKGSNAVYDANCASCHGADGKGMNGMAPNLVEYDDAIVAAVLKHGKKGNIGEMPNFDTRLNDTQIKGVAAYLRSLGGN
jgi:cytochrome c oxidase cbb3-type subunit 3